MPRSCRAKEIQAWGPSAPAGPPERTGGLSSEKGFRATQPGCPPRARAHTKDESSQATRGKSLAGLVVQLEKLPPAQMQTRSRSKTRPVVNTSIFARASGFSQRHLRQVFNRENRERNESKYKIKAGWCEAHGRNEGTLRAPKGAGTSLRFKRDTRCGCQPGGCSPGEP